MINDTTFLNSVLRTSKNMRILSPLKVGATCMSHDNVYKLNVSIGI